MNAHRLAIVLVLLAAPALAHEHGEVSTAKGVVFHDANWNRRFDDGEQGIAGIKVSNGKDIVVTDDHGRYQIDVTDDTIVFVVKPRGWRTPLNEHRLPRFYYIHKPHGSPPLKYRGVEPTGALPDAIHFPLYPQKEPDQFKAILFGDPQPRDQKEIDYISHDVVEELIGSDASFGVTLGDIMFDNLDLFESLNKTIALIGIPWYNVIGNHDLNFDAQHDHHSDETFERHFGPSYYSFDYGPVHFLVLDDVEWYIPPDDPKGKGTYRGGLGQRQMEFIKNDLALIPESQMVVLLMHIPLVEVHDRQALYRLIEKRPFCMSVSGHTHYHEHRYIKKADGWLGAEPHHHIINVTVSGSWWTGAPDERGIPHTTMKDGAPNGYSILSFDGNKYKLDYKAAGRSTDYQIQLSAPEEVRSDQLAQTHIYANFFNGSERSVVETRVGEGAWRKMPQVTEVDPHYKAVYAAEARILLKSWRDLPSPRATPHLWKTTMPEDLIPGTHLIQVRATDTDGRQFAAQRVVRVLAAPIATATK